MFNKKKKMSQKQYEEKLCLGFNGGALLLQKLDKQSHFLCNIILESLADKHKEDPLFKGLASGFNHEYKRLRNIRANQLKKIQEQNHQKDKNNGWQR
ncbi:MAG: hypothetical protein ACPG6V_09680 [Flavobacteriales bacterium]